MKGKTNDITQGVIWKQILIFFFPILLGTFFQQLYNTADAIIVGNYLGKVALSAVGGSTGTLVNLMVGFFVGLSSGATVIISQYYGAKDAFNTGRAVHTAVALAIVAGIILSVVGIIFAPSIIRLLNTPEEVMAQATPYIRVFFAGAVGNLIYNIGAGILRAVGDSKRPLYILMASCVLNVILDIFFISVLHMGVAGAALATIICQAVAASLVLLMLYKTREIYRFRPRETKLHKDLLVRVFHIGLPAGIQSVSYSLSNMVIQAGMNTFGTDTIAAWAAFSKIDGIYWMILGAFGISVTTFVGQNYGAGRYDRVKQGVKICFAMAMGTSITISGLLYLFGGSLVRLFVDDPSVIEIGTGLIRFLMPFFSTYVCLEIFPGALRGLGDTIVPMLVVCLGVCLVRALWVWFVAPVFPVVYTVLLSYPVSWILASSLILIYYFKFSSMRKLRMPGMELDLQ